MQEILKKLNPIAAIQELHNFRMRIKKSREAFTPDEQRIFLNTYIEKKKIPTNIDKTLAEANKINSRPGYESLFKNLKVLGGDKTVGALCDEFAKKPIPNDPNNALNGPSPVIAGLSNLDSNPNIPPTPEDEKVTRALASFKTRITDFSNTIKNNPLEYSPLGAREYLSQKKDGVLRALEQKQKSEKQVLVDKFDFDRVDFTNHPNNPANFRNELATALAIQKDAPGNPSPQIDSVKDEFVKALEEKHKQEKSNLENALNEDIRAMDIAYSAEFARYELAKTLYTNAELFKANKLKELVEGKFDENHPNAELMLEEDVKKNKEAILQELTFEQMCKVLVTTTGQEITAEEKPANSGKYSVSMQLRSGYIAARLYDPAADFKTLVKAAIAAGVRPAHMTLSNPAADAVDKDGNLSPSALKEAQIFYAEAIKEGYKPEEIKFKVNGLPKDTKNDKGETEKTYFKPDDLFKNNPSMLENAKKIAERKSEQLDWKKTSVEERKREVANIRNTRQGGPEEPEYNPPQNN